MGSGMLPDLHFDLSRNSKAENRRGRVDCSRSTVRICIYSTLASLLIPFSSIKIGGTGSVRMDALPGLDSG